MGCDVTLLKRSPKLSREVRASRGMLILAIFQCSQGKDVRPIGWKTKAGTSGRFEKDKIVWKRLSFCKRGDQHLSRYMRTFRRQTQRTLATDLRIERCISDCRTEYVLEDVDVSAKKSWRLRKSKCLTKRRSRHLFRLSSKGKYFWGVACGNESASGLESQLRTRTKSGSVILDRHLPATLLECPPCSEIKGL